MKYIFIIQKQSCDTVMEAYVNGLLLKRPHKKQTSKQTEGK